MSEQTAEKRIKVSTERCLLTDPGYRFGHGQWCFGCDKCDCVWRELGAVFKAQGGFNMSGLKVTLGIINSAKANRSVREISPGPACPLRMR